MTGASYASIEAARRVVPRPLFIVPEDKSASWLWRVEWPTEALRNHGYTADWCLSHNAPNLVNLIEMGRWNCVVTPRIAWPAPNMAREWATLVHSVHLPWIYEVDDDGWAPDIAARQASLIMDEWRKGQLRLEEDREQRIEIINEVDAVFVSSEPLVQVASALTDKPVFCLPNMIYSAFYKQVIDVSKRIVPPLTVGWSGGLRSNADLALVAEAWSRIAARYPQVLFVVHGSRLPVLLDALPPDRVRFLPWTALPDYPRALLNIDIACCSVEAGKQFNVGKTCIKWYETTLAGATCVVSRELYGREVTDGVDGLVCETADEWEAAISRLIENPRLRKRLHKKALDKVMAEHTMEGQWWRWAETLGQVLELYQASRNGALDAAVA